MTLSQPSVAASDQAAPSRARGEDTQGAAMQDVILRWEWRMFAPKLSRNILTLIGEPREARFTRENYILSFASPDNVKVRDDVIDIKLVEQVDRHGLQQWRPALKSNFPLDHEALAALWSAWRIPAPVLARPSYTLSQLIQEIVEPEPALCSVPVEKTRSRIIVDGCSGELVHLVVRGEKWESLALEDPYPLRVWRAVKHLGLNGIENTSYPAALKQILGLVAADTTINQEDK